MPGRARAALLASSSPALLRMRFHAIWAGKSIHVPQVISVVRVMVFMMITIVMMITKTCYHLPMMIGPSGAGVHFDVTQSDLAAI